MWWGRGDGCEGTCGCRSGGGIRRYMRGRAGCRGGGRRESPRWERAVTEDDPKAARKATLPHHLAVPPAGCPSSEGHLRTTNITRPRKQQGPLARCSCLRVPKSVGQTPTGTDNKCIQPRRERGTQKRTRFGTQKRRQGRKNAAKIGHKNAAKTGHKNAAKKTDTQMDTKMAPKTPWKSRRKFDPIFL